ncbi:MAG: hypothetical protein GY772_01965, partial [bacterium]|nr:hypothetical protein [bacterium]
MSMAASTSSASGSAAASAASAGAPDSGEVALVSAPAEASATAAALLAEPKPSVQESSPGGSDTLGPVISSQGRMAGLTKCYFDCGRMYRIDGETVNIGNKRYPRYCCHPCYAVRRLLTGQCRGDPEAAAYLEKMRTQEPEAYKAKVRQCRLRSDPTEAGVDSKGERAGGIGSFVQSVEASVSIREEVSVHWLTQHQFMAHYKYVEGLGELEAASAWESAVSDPTVQRRGQGADVRVAVRGAPRTVAQRTRTRRTTVAATRAIDATEEATALQQGRVAMASATPTHSDFLDSGGEVFVGAAMAGESSLASASAAEFATAVRADAPLPRPVIGPAELAVAPTTVKRRASNPPTPRKSAKKAPPRASAAK